MRDIILIISALIIGKLVALVNYNLGFNISFFLIVIFLWGPVFIAFIKVKRLKLKAIAILEDLDCDYTELKPKVFWPRVRGVRISSAQLVFSTEVNKNKCWFIFGSWWLGCLNDVQKVYIEIDGKLEPLNQNKIIEGSLPKREKSRGKE